MKVKPKIIIIDDEVDLAQNLRDIMKEEDYQVVATYDGKTGIALCSENRFDVALIDIMLPDIPGIDVARRIVEVSPKTGCILITANASLEIAVDAIKQEGVVALELKPLNIEHILQIVSDVIKQKEAEEFSCESEGRNYCGCTY